MQEGLRKINSNRHDKMITSTSQLSGLTKEGG